MSGMSDYLENKLLDFLFRGQAFVPPGSLYVALFTADPTDAGGGTEVTGGSYARVAVTSSLANWAGSQATASTTASSGTSGTTSNNGSITFPSPTANWGVIQGIAIMDNSVGGNVLFYGALGTPKTVNNGDAAPTFPATALAVQIDN